MPNDRRRLQGRIVSNKMDKTVVVEVARTKQHRLYKKVIRTVKKYMAHDESNALQIGDIVQIVESRPMSRHKRWAVESIVVRPEDVVVGEELDAISQAADVASEAEEAEVAEVAAAEAAEVEAAVEEVAAAEVAATDVAQAEAAEAEVAVASVEAEDTQGESESEASESAEDESDAESDADSESESKSED